MAGEIPAAFGQDHLVKDQPGESGSAHRERGMKPAGLEAIDFQVALDANPRAMAFFTALDRANRYAILWRMQNVKKAGTRASRIERFVAMLERHEQIHP